MTALEQAVDVLADIGEQHQYMQSKRFFIPDQALEAADRILEKSKALVGRLMEEAEHDAN